VRSAPGLAPRRRSTWLGRRTAAGLALGALLGVAGLFTLLVLWVGLLTTTLRTGLADAPGTADPASTCVVAATDGVGDAAVTSTLFPPRAVCTWTTDGLRTTTVLAERSAPLATAAAVAAAAGVLTVVLTVGGTWWARRTARATGDGPGSA
jgi:hypothetical protein